MKTATNIYIFNLALADALVTTTMPFQSTDYLLNTWPFGEVVCKVFISIDYYNMFTSIFTLTMMSVDRYVAVCHPVKALDFRTPIKAKMINVCIWILSSAAGIPAFVLGGTQTNSGELELLQLLNKSFIPFFYRWWRFPETECKKYDFRSQSVFYQVHQSEEFSISSSPRLLLKINGITNKNKMFPSDCRLAFS